MTNKFKYFIYSLLLVLCFSTCKKNDEEPSSLTVTTISITDITFSSAKCNGKVSFTGNYSVGNCGSCWSESPSPTIDNYFTTDIQGQGSFVSKLQNLKSSTRYYVRAYATTSSGIVYGDELVFDTESNGGGPQIGLTVSLGDVYDIHGHSAKCDVVVSYDNNNEITELGVYWSVSENPMIYNYHMSCETSLGNHSVELNNLEPGTTYHVRAYAINTSGAAIYTQEEKTFTTFSKPQVSTLDVTNIAPTEAVGHGVLEENGGTIETFGFCWSTSPDPEPTIHDNIVYANGSETGDFTASLTNLTPNTTYFVRAFATNEIDTSYGNMVSFTTLPNPITLSDFLGVFSVTALNRETDQYESWDGTNIYTFQNSTTNTIWIKVEGLLDGAGHNYFTAIGEYSEEHHCIRLYSGWGLTGSSYHFYFLSNPDVKYYARFFPIYQTTGYTYYYLENGAGYDNSGEAWLTMESDGTISLGPSLFPDGNGRYANGFEFSYYKVEDNSYAGSFERYTNVTLTRTMKTHINNKQPLMETDYTKNSVNTNEHPSNRTLIKANKE